MKCSLYILVWLFGYPLNVCFCLQGDGNFVVYDSGNRPVWASGTDGSGAVHVLMQADGNLVVYNQHGQAKWSSGTYINSPCEMCRLELTDGGKLELTRNFQRVWSSWWNYVFTWPHKALLNWMVCKYKSSLNVSVNYNKTTCYVIWNQKHVFSL